MRLFGLQFDIGANASKVYTEFTKIGARARSVATSIGGSFAAIGAGLLAGVGTVGVALNSIIDTGAEMEAYSSRLTTMMGSAAAAQERMAELFEFAASTPFELGQVVAAEVTLRGFGAAAEELMPGLIDFAAGTGAELSQSAIDIGKAWNQGATGLESDSAKILRSQIEARTGIDATTMSLEAFREALQTELNEGMFAGGAEKLSQTMSGMLANLNDEWTRFKLNVSDAGIFNNVKGLLQNILRLIGENRVEIGRMAGVVSDVLWGSLQLVILGIAEAVDFTEAWAFAFAKVGSIAADFTSKMVDDWRLLVTGAAELADALGQDALGAKLWGAADALADIETGLMQSAYQADQWANGLDATNNRWAQAKQLIEDAETAAKGFGTTLEDVGAGAGAGAGAVGGGEGDPKEDERRRKQLEDDINAALDFADQMAAVRENEYQAAARQRAENMAELEAFNAEGLITGQLYADTRLAIEQEYYAQVSDLRAADAEEQARLDQEALERRRDMLDLQFSAAADVFGGISDLLETENGKQTSASKAAAHAQLFINEAVAIGKAIAQYGFPAALLPIAAIGTTAIAGHASVNKAHQGRIFGDTDEISGGGLTTLKQEMAVLNSQAVRRYAAEIQSMNSGTYRGGGTTVVDLRVNDAMQRAVVGSQLSGQTPLRNAIDSRRTTRSTGMRGSGAAA